MLKSRILKRLRLSFIVIAALFFYSMFIAAAVRSVFHTPHQGREWFGDFAKYIKLFSEIPSDMKTFLSGTTTELNYRLTSGKYLPYNPNIKDGFTYHKNIEYENSPKLLISYKESRFVNKFELYDINSGNILKGWEPDSKLLTELTFNEAHNMHEGFEKFNDYYYIHPLMLPDSSIITNNHLSLSKFDKNSEILWVKNDKYYHHGIEPDSDGNIYVCAHPFRSRKFDFLPLNYNDTIHNYVDDEITKLDAITGEILYSKSVTEILIENGYEWLILAKGIIDRDPIHLNDIEPALYDTEHWQKGDLLLSSRHLSTVLLYRPETNKVLWLEMGPWYNQHDVDFLDSNKIVLYSNAVFRFNGKDQASKLNGYFSKARSTNQIYVYNFENNEVSTPYDDLMRTENIRSPSQGRCDILPNGDIFIEETDKGRIIFGDSKQKKISFAKRKNDKYLQIIHWARLIN